MIEVPDPSKGFRNKQSKDKVLAKEHRIGSAGTNPDKLRKVSEKLL